MSPPMPATRQLDRSRSAAPCRAPGGRRGRSRRSGCRRWCRGCARSGSATAPGGGRSRASADSRSRAGRRAGQQEADQAHVVIERQPGHRAVAGDDVQPGRARHAGDIGHQRRLRDRHAERKARAARGELQIAEVVRSERPEIDGLSGSARARPSRCAGGRRETAGRRRPGSRRDRRRPGPPPRRTRRAGGATGRDRPPCRRSRGGSRPAPAAGRTGAPKKRSKKPGQVSAAIRIRSPSAKPAPISRRAVTWARSRRSRQARAEVSHP